MKHVERRAALEDEASAQNLVAGDLLQQVHQAQDLSIVPAWCPVSLAMRCRVWAEGAGHLETLEPAFDHLGGKDHVPAAGDLAVAGLCAEPIAGLASERARAAPR